jgi:hypothetical protein
MDMSSFANLDLRRNSFAPSAARFSSALPSDARAIIRRAPKSVMQSAPAHRRPWLLHFEHRVAPGVDPLTGWTSGADPLVHVSLRFPDLASAIRYAERHNLPYKVHEEAPTRPRTPIRPHTLNPLRSPINAWPSRDRATACDESKREARPCRA